MCVYAKASRGWEWHACVCEDEWWTGMACVCMLRRAVDGNGMCVYAQTSGGWEWHVYVCEDDPWMGIEYVCVQNTCE